MMAGEEGAAVTEDWTNKLYFGDNLGIMRDYIGDETVDLIYLDPPFNSKATYNVLFGERDSADSGAQITAFEDSWHWGMESESAYHELVMEGPKKLADLMQALRSFLGQNDMMAYLVMMAIRLVEMHRVLKRTGSIYLHCDPTASHYLKLVMDAVFGARNFRNEIVWYYRRWTAASKMFQRMHDVVFWYSRSGQWTYNRLMQPFSEKTAIAPYKRKVEGGRSVQDKSRPMDRDAEEGVAMHDVWEIPIIHPIAKERLGYPTQKPEALLERILNASSNAGDLVVDPFCGCGTTVAVAERLGRRWVGIDVTYLAVNLMKRRLSDTFGEELSRYKVIGVPTALYEARALAEENRYQFEWWAVDLVGARPARDKKKGADSGVDGYINFFDDESGQAKRIIVQVKSGGVKRSDIATLNSDRQREKAEVGAFITLEEPTRPMREEAAGAGFYVPELHPDRKYPRIQILTIEEILNGKELQYPQWGTPATFKRAQRRGKGKDHEQGRIV